MADELEVAVRTEAERGNAALAALKLELASSKDDAVAHATNSVRLECAELKDRIGKMADEIARAKRETRDAIAVAQSNDMRAKDFEISARNATEANRGLISKIETLKKELEEEKARYKQLTRETAHQHNTRSVEDESSLGGGSDDVAGVERPEASYGRVDGAAGVLDSRQRRDGRGASRASLMKQVAQLQALVVSMQEAMAADAGVEVPVVAAHRNSPKLSGKARMWATNVRHAPPPSVRRPVTVLPNPHAQADENATAAWASTFRGGCGGAKRVAPLVVG